MSLFGSLFSGVSGLAAQSQAMAMISDNISNVNTVGYKATTARFETLVTGNGSADVYSPGGVRSTPFRLVSQQGLIQASASPLDIALQGNGFFVVRPDASAEAETLYTRAGSFRPDSLGNLVNVQGLFLQGWPLDADGRLPGEIGNTTNPTSSADLGSLETVSVQAINGVAASTTEVTMGANLRATQAILTGPLQSTVSLGLTSSTDLGLTAGDQIDFTSGGNSLTATYNPAPGAGEFSTLQDLADLINATSAFSATISGAAADATLVVTGTDPRQNLSIADVGAGTAANAIFGTGSITIGKTYDPTASATNMASGTVTPHFSRTVRVFDAQGGGHDLALDFIKVAQNTWAVEISSAVASEVSATAPLINGQLVTGTVAFNGDATLQSLSAALAQPITIDWTNGASPSGISFNFGTEGFTDGLSQFDSAFNVSFLNQNGSEVGQLNGVTIDDDGFVIAAFNNGETRRLYKLPIATFADPTELQARDGNVFAQTDASGEFNLREAGNGGAGTIAASALEAANVDLAKEFSDMIITQRAFSASSRIIATVDEMLEELIRIRR
ncbi:MAG: flagellar hook protein FlgE [Alphaproteobacteria bacterium]